MPDAVSPMKRWVGACDHGADWNTLTMGRADRHEQNHVATPVRAMKAFGTVTIPAPGGLTRAQELELDRRLDAYRENPAAGSPWPEVRARILNRSSTRK
jgi:hypothetical protein